MTNHTTFASRGNETRENESDKYTHAWVCGDDTRGRIRIHNTHPRFTHDSSNSRRTIHTQAWLHYARDGEGERERGRDGRCNNDGHTWSTEATPFEVDGVGLTSNQPTDRPRVSER